ncbi:hypothetical protein ACIA47_25210 [Micromonospora sp. NPDC051227]|uniref:hypothetical protein n=1 Tax=Micromonospora sp. NPDC051227 TaxID=3364285 RepID=UPI0037A70587
MFVALLTGGGLTVVGGFVQAWLTSRDATARDDRRHLHELDMAREQRHHQRIENAYEELLLLVETIGQWASMIRPLVTIEGDPRPQLPPLPEQARVEALVRAYGSQKVRDRLFAWRQVIDQLIEADFQIQAAERSIERQGHTSIDDGAERMKIGTQLRPAERARRNELAEEIAAELRAPFS